MEFILVQARKGEGWGGGGNRGAYTRLFTGRWAYNWGVLISDGGGLIGGRSMKR